MRVPKVIPVTSSRSMWRLQEPWQFAHHDGVYVIIPSGFIFDLASIPKWARSFVQKSDRRTWGPSLEHDYRCRYHVGTSYDTHKAFYLALRGCGMSKLKSLVIYFAVRIGGPSW